MSYLKYIDDEKLTCLVKSVIEVGINRKKEAEEKFVKNVIDPFGSVIEVAAFDVDHEFWKVSETIRQCQKTLQNHIGELHQKILGNVPGWQDLDKGGIVDLVNPQRKIIAEIKNKYNTVTGGKLADQYYSLERLVSPKASQYKGFTSYFVNIIPKKPERFDRVFIPSDKDKGMRCAANDKIRIIDGASFYSLVTGRENALAEFYSALPQVIESIFRHDYSVEDYELPDKSEFQKYFDLAYKI